MLEARDGENKMQPASTESTTPVVKKREWKCFRCQDPINIFVSDEDKKYIIEGDKIFCSKHCCSYAKQHIPVDPVKKKINDFKKKGSSKKIKQIKEPLFKCFRCDRVRSYMTWDKLCGHCKDEVPYSELTNEYLASIRLHKIN